MFGRKKQESSPESHSLHKAAGVIIQNRKLLVVRSAGKDYFIAPGGRVESGETTEDALVREMMEELTIETASGNLQFLHFYFAEAANHPGEIIRMDVYFVAKWLGQIQPSNEIEELAWVTSDNPDNLLIGSIFRDKVIPLLKENNLID